MRKMMSIALIAMMAITSTSFAQTQFGIQAGPNFATAKIENTYTVANVTTTEKLDTKSKAGFLVGVLAEIPFSSSINFRPELNFIQKGYKTDYTKVKDNETTRYESKTVLNYIELPLNFVYQMPSASGSFFIGAGPSFGFGLSGKYDETKTKTKNSVITIETIKQDIKFDGKSNLTATDLNSHLKSFDFGGNALVGYKFTNGFFINAIYTLGFANISPDANSTFKNSGFGLKLGYMFGSSKAKPMTKKM